MVLSSKIHCIHVMIMRKIQFDGNTNMISRQLKHHRTKAGLSQRELAARLQVLGVNMDQQMVSKIERNMRIVTDYELACICQVLQVELSEMLYDFYLAQDSQ